jgi:hypothetical protein
MIEHTLILEGTLIEQKVFFIENKMQSFNAISSRSSFFFVSFLFLSGSQKGSQITFSSCFSSVFAVGVSAAIV